MGCNTSKTDGTAPVSAPAEEKAPEAAPEAAPSATEAAAGSQENAPQDAPAEDAEAAPAESESWISAADERTWNPEEGQDEESTR